MQSVSALKADTLEFKAKVILRFRSWQHLPRQEDKSVNKLSNTIKIDRRTIGNWVRKETADKILAGKIVFD